MNKLGKLQKEIIKLDKLLLTINADYVAMFDKFNKLANTVLDTHDKQEEMNEILIKIQSIYWNDLIHFNNYVRNRYDFAMKSDDHFKQWLDGLKKNECVKSIDHV